jgi:hypothetical protein
MKMYEVSADLRRLADKVDSGSSSPLDFGQILDKLRELAGRGLGGKWIHFEWGCARPLGYDSFRGDYSQICLEYGGEHRHHQTVDGLLKITEGLIGTELTGWKGGEYTVERDKDVYVCCSGNTSNTRVVDIVYDEDVASSVIIKTSQIED